MKKHLLLFAVLISTFAFAQEKKKHEGRNFHWLSEQDIVGVSGGQFQPDMKKFNDQLKVLGAKSVFYQGLRGYGLTMASTFPISRKLEFDGSAAFDLLLPANVTIGKNDSLHYQVKGWRFMTSLYGKDIIPGSIVALVLAPGIDWGVLKMKRTLGGNGSLFKNGYIAPLARAELRFVFGPVVVGARGIYRYDVTKEDWKLKSGPGSVLPGTKNTGTSIEFFVGWGRVHFQ